MAGVQLVAKEGVGDINVGQQVQHQAAERQVCATSVGCMTAWRARLGSEKAPGQRTSAHVSM